MPGLGLFNCVSSLRKKIRKRTNIPITLPPKFLARPAQHRENETCTSGATAGSSVRLEDVLNYDEVLVHSNPQWKQDVSAQRQVSKHGIQCSDQESNYTSEDDEKTDEELEDVVSLPCYLRAEDMTTDLARPAQHRENETCTSGATAGSSVRLEDVLNYDEVLVHFNPQWKQDVSAQRQVSKHGIQCSDQESNYTSEDDENIDEALEDVLSLLCYLRAENMTTCPPLDEYSGNRYLRRDHMLHVNLIDPMAAEKTEIPVQILFKVIPTSIMLDKTLRINIVVYPKSIKADRSDDVFGHYVQELVNLDLPEQFSVSVNGVRDGWKLMSGVNQASKECPIQPDAISNISFNLRNSDQSSTGTFSVDFDIYGTQQNHNVTIAGTIYQWITDERELSLMYHVVSPPVQQNVAKSANRTRGHKTRGSRRRKPKSSVCVVDSSTSDTNSNSPRGNDNQAVTKPKALIGVTKPKEMFANEIQSALKLNIQYSDSSAENKQCQHHGNSKSPKKHSKLSYTAPKALVANVKNGSDIPSDLKLHSLHFSDSSNDNTKRIFSSDMCFTLESA